MSFETNRRQFLRGAIAASALLAAQSRVLSLNYERRFAPVKVSRDRVIREVVGLRPYRAEGFVRGYQQLWIKAQKSQIIVFLYQFKTNAGARRDFGRTVEHFRSKPPAGLHLRAFTLHGLPSGQSLGVAVSDKTGSAALVFFTTGVFNVEIDANDAQANSPLPPLQRLGTTLAQDQLSRLRS